MGSKHTFGQCEDIVPSHSIGRTYPGRVLHRDSAQTQECSQDTQREIISYKVSYIGPYKNQWVHYVKKSDTRQLCKVSNSNLMPAFGTIGTKGIYQKILKSYFVGLIHIGILSNALPRWHKKLTRCVCDWTFLSSKYADAMDVTLNIIWLSIAKCILSIIGDF